MAVLNNTVGFAYILAFLVVAVTCMQEPDANRLNSIHRVEDYLDLCLDGKHHKGHSSPESNLFAQCTPWKNRSCCTEETTHTFHIDSNWYNFDWNHCQPLSSHCRAHFLQDLCFYECSPNVGPWLVKVDMKIRREKFVNVPMCRRECDLWWHDCQDDFTCVKNWGKEFDWTTGKNNCPTDAMCQKFSSIYKDSTEFCETVWDHSWKVVAETESCMHLWFDADRPNPNDKVARQQAEKLLITNTGTNICPHICVLLLIFFINIFFRIH